MRWCWCFIFITLLVAGGCVAKETAWVSGDVTFDGKEIPDGVLRFFPIEGTTGSGGGAEIVNGKYQISPEMANKNEMVAGSYRISVMASQKTGRKVPHPEGKGTIEQSVMYIPHRYNQETQLIAELEAGENEHNLVLER